MRLYLTVDGLGRFDDDCEQPFTYHSVTPIVDDAHDHSSFYSSAIQERLNWARECCGHNTFAVYVCQMCNGWVIVNTIVFEFSDDNDALHFKLRWL
jgi:hypothetical protein